MKRILLSLAVSGAVLGTAIYATNAFFSDVETSTGNTFQAGKLDLKISSQCTYNGQTSSQCGDWESDDLKNVQSPKFFNFSDVKPGDWGENTIDFTVVDNDAWMCAKLDATTHEKLADYLQVFWWVDDGDNLYENGEKILYNGAQPLSSYLNLTNPLPMTFADKVMNWKTGIAGDPIPGNVKQYLGVGWCFGQLTITGTGAPGFTCNGSGNQNDAQGTKVVADLEFTVEQYRNNPDFLCPEHQVQ